MNCLIERIIQCIFVVFIGLGISGGMCAAPEEPIVKEVMSEGYGKDPQEAIQNAAKSALINVAGSFVDADTLIQNRTKIDNDLKETTKIINKDIKEYSQGSIKSIDVLNVAEEGGLFKATAKVAVRMDDFELYLKKLSVAKTDVDSSLFSQIAASRENSKNAKELVVKNVLMPIADRTALEVKVGKPMALESSSLGEGFKQLFKKEANRYPNLIPVVFELEVNPKKGYFENARKVLKEISKEKTMTKYCGGGDKENGDLVITFPKSPDHSLVEEYGSCERYVIDSGALGRGQWTKIEKLDKEHGFIQLSFYEEEGTEPMEVFLAESKPGEKNRYGYPTFLVAEVSDPKDFSWVHKGDGIANAYGISGLYPPSFIGTFRLHRKWYALVLTTPEILKSTKFVEATFSQDEDGDKS